MITEFFVLGGFVFWVMVSILVVLYCLSSYHEHPAPAIVGTIGFLGLLELFSNARPFALLSTRPIVFIAGIALYVILGLCWSLVKWVLHVNRRRIEFERSLLSQSRHNGYTEGTAEYIRLKTSLKRDYYPRVYDEIERIITWVVCWPFSVIGEFFGNFLHELMLTIVKMLRGIYEYLGSMVWKDES